MKHYIIPLFLLISTLVTAQDKQDKPAYRIFDGSGKKIPFTKMINALEKGEVIFFGELHNNPIAHWMELEVAHELYRQDTSLSIGMEMFEADDQVVVNEYLKGAIDERNFKNEAKLWDNYDTDYKPLVEFAREKGVRLIATNIPRRYASMVFKKGIGSLEILGAESKAWMAPLPVKINLELPGYKDMMEQMGGHGGSDGAVNLATSQAMKDATMAYFISKNRKGKFLHVNGGYHTQKREGIIWHLKEIQPLVKIISILVVEQPLIEELDKEHADTADFIICIPANMTKTF